MRHADEVCFKSRVYSQMYNISLSIQNVLHFLSVKMAVDWSHSMFMQTTTSRWICISYWRYKCVSKWTTWMWNSFHMPISVHLKSVKHLPKLNENKLDFLANAKKKMFRDVCCDLKQNTSWLNKRDTKRVHSRVAKKKESRFNARQNVVCTIRAPSNQGFNVNEKKLVRVVSR